jgi:acyl carrier protein
MQDQFPDLPTIDAEELAVLCTLEQIISSFGSSTALPAVHVEDSSVRSVESLQAEPTLTPVDQSEIEQAFLAVVSEKTGYPVDMLETGMDMEADLGIDSIKRVEILSAMQDQFPHLPTIEAEELAALRTLEQIIAAFNQAPVSQAVPLTKGELPDSPDRKEVNPAAPAVHHQDGGEIQTAFLAVVSEKTGYPVDMLELGMDMEADLGIDSIKRVEILSAMQDQLPHLPAIEAEELALLRTLGEIIAKFSQPLSEPTADIPQNRAVDQEKIEKQDQAGISVSPVTIKRLPDPDWLEFNIPEDNLILITDDGAGRARRLAETLQSQGKSVGMVNIGKQIGKDTDHSATVAHNFEIKNADENEVRRVMDGIIADHEKIVAFIHVHPPANKSKKGLLQIPEDEEAILKSVFLIARHLKKPLVAAAGICRPAFMTLSCMDGHFGLNGYDALSPVAGGLAGLAKSLRLEWPEVFCRALDFHPQLDEQFIVDRTLAEWHDPNLDLSEVGYTLEGRITLCLDDSRKDE